MSKNTSEQDHKRWKQKYYDHLDLLDKKEKDWQILESILKKSVLKLSIAAEGQHKSMDQYLHDIRSMMKRQLNIHSLENSLDDISALLIKMADKQKSEDRKVITALTHLVENIHFPEKASKQKNKLISKLSRSTDKDYSELEKQVQKLLSNNITRDPDSHSEQTKLGLIKSLFSPVNKSSDSVHLEHEQHEANNHSHDSSLFNHSSHAGSEDSGPSAREILIRLLEQLTVPSDLHSEIEDLKQRIEEENSNSSWKVLLMDVVQLINTLRNRMQEEKQEFETFLQQITGRLREIDNVLSTGDEALNEAEKAGGAFETAVSAHVQDIHDDMSTADDLDDLKDKVEKRLNIVSEHIKEYRNNEQTRFKDAQKNTEDMRSRLLQLERESSDLKQLILEKNKEAMFDVLTGIPNRLSYEKKAAEEIARCNRFTTPLSMAVWDIDQFKQVNDTYGHKVGDKVLKAVAQLLEERMRETDFIARYGGEEFVMFLPGADETEALKLADVLRERIASIRFNNKQDAIKITISCGISSFSKKDTHESMFERADRALYAAKRNGRNQCLTSSTAC